MHLQICIRKLWLHQILALTDSLVTFKVYFLSCLPAWPLPFFSSSFSIYLTPSHLNPSLFLHIIPPFVAQGRQSPLKAHLGLCSLVPLLTEPRLCACWVDPHHNTHSITQTCREKGETGKTERKRGGNAWVTDCPQWLRETEGGEGGGAWTGGGNTAERRGGGLNERLEKNGWQTKVVSQCKVI